MKQGGAFLQSLRATEPLQTMKSGILQSGMYDAFQNTYSMQYVCMCASIIHNIHVCASCNMYVFKHSLQLIPTPTWFMSIAVTAEFTLVFQCVPVLMK